MCCCRAVIPSALFEDANLDDAWMGQSSADLSFGSDLRLHHSVSRPFERALMRVAECLVRRVKDLKVGNGLEPEVDIGPLINEKAVAKVERLVSDAMSRGETREPAEELATHETFFEPTVLAKVTPEMALAIEETFGPVAALRYFMTNLKRSLWQIARNMVLPAISTPAILPVHGAWRNGWNAGWSVSIPAFYLLRLRHLAEYRNNQALSVKVPYHGLAEFLVLKYLNIGGIG